MTALKSSYSGFVYLIGSTRFGWYKIGLALNPTIRVTDIGILLPFRIELWAIWKTSDRYRLEREMHEKYQNYAINGEWFCFELSQLREVIEDVQPFDAVRTLSGFESPEACVRFSNIWKDTIKIGASGTGRNRKLREMAVHQFLAHNVLIPSPETLRYAYRLVSKTARETNWAFKIEDLIYDPTNPDLQPTSAEDAKSQIAQQVKM